MGFGFGKMWANTMRQAGKSPWYIKQGLNVMTAMKPELKRFAASTLIGASVGGVYAGLTDRNVLSGMAGGAAIGGAGYLGVRALGAWGNAARTSGRTASNAVSPMRLLGQPAGGTSSLMNRTFGGRPMLRAPGMHTPSRRAAATRRLNSARRGSTSRRTIYG